MTVAPAQQLAFPHSAAIKGELALLRLIASLDGVSNALLECCQGRLFGLGLSTQKKVFH